MFDVISWQIGLHNKTNSLNTCGILVNKKAIVCAFAVWFQVRSEIFMFKVLVILVFQLFSFLMLTASLKQSPQFYFWCYFEKVFKVYHHVLGSARLYKRNKMLVPATTPIIQ